MGKQTLLARPGYVPAMHAALQSSYALRTLLRNPGINHWKLIVLQALAQLA
jgi:hypothetical protein